MKKISRMDFYIQTHFVQEDCLLDDTTFEELSKIQSEHPDGIEMNDSKMLEKYPNASIWLTENAVWPRTKTAKIENLIENQNITKDDEKEFDRENQLYSDMDQRLNEFILKIKKAQTNDTYGEELETNIGE